MDPLHSKSPYDRILLVARHKDTSCWQTDVFEWSEIAMSHTHKHSCGQLKWIYRCSLFVPRTLSVPGCFRRLFLCPFFSFCLQELDAWIWMSLFECIYVFELLHFCRETLLNNCFSKSRSSSAITGGPVAVCMSMLYLYDLQMQLQICRLERKKKKKKLQIRHFLSLSLSSPLFLSLFASLLLLLILIGETKICRPWHGPATDHMPPAIKTS